MNRLNNPERIRVLILDDDVLACEALRLSLVGEPFDVVGIEHKATISAQVLAKLEPDVILLDEDLLELSGPAPYEQMKFVGDDFPVMILTTDASPLAVASALAAGASAVVSKKRLDLHLLPDMIRVLARGKDAVVDGSVARAAMAAVSDGKGRSGLTDGKGSVRNPDDLSLLELDVLQIAVHGYEDREIAERLAMEVETVKAKIESICRKLHVEDRSRLAAMGSRLGLANEK